MMVYGGMQIRTQGEVKKMRYFYDFEFSENGSTIEPISLGMVSEDNRQLYLINNTYMRRVWEKKHIPNPWLQENVINKITDEDAAKFGYNIKLFPDLVLKFISDNGKYKSRDEIELWGHYAAYDHVCLAQLWGPMINLPEPIPMFTHEDMTIKRDQPYLTRDLNKYPEHHALYDAKFQRLQSEYWQYPSMLIFKQEE